MVLAFTETRSTGSESARKVGAHLVKVGAQARRPERDECIDVLDCEATAAYMRAHSGEVVEASRALGLRVLVVREEPPEVAFDKSASERVHECVAQHVAIRRRVKALLCRDIDASENKWTADYEPVDVVPRPTRRRIVASNTALLAVVHR